MDFTNKVVLITGASRGIGRACAVLFAERGARVAINYQRNRAAAEETRALLRGEGHMLIQADVANPDEVERMVSAVVEQMEGLHILVNNAGIYEDHPLPNVTYAEWQAAWRRILEANLLGAANTIYCVARHMMTAGGGRIVNVSSRGAFRGEPDAPAYGASKAGLNSMGQSLAKALAPHHIYVLTVAPGFVETDMAADMLEGPAGEAIRQQSPLGRVAKAEEVAYAVLFCAAEESAFSTGAIIDVNGASYLRT